MKYLILGFFLLPTASFASNCANNAAIVRIQTQQVEQLTSLVRSFNSIPLDARVISSSGSTSVVEVAVPADYAKANGIDSFAVASRVASLRSYYKLPIASIKAEDCFTETSMLEDVSEEFTNVGTIGHAR